MQTFPYLAFLKIYPSIPLPSCTVLHYMNAHSLFHWSPPYSLLILEIVLEWIALCYFFLYFCCYIFKINFWKWNYWNKSKCICWDNWISTGKIMKLGPYFISHTKINSKLIKDLNIWAVTIKLLEENRGESLPEHGFGNGFLNMIPKEQATREKK